MMQCLNSVVQIDSGGVPKHQPQIVDSNCSTPATTPPDRKRLRKGRRGSLTNSAGQESSVDGGDPYHYPTDESGDEFEGDIIPEKLPRAEPVEESDMSMAEFEEGHGAESVDGEADAARSLRSASGQKLTPSAALKASLRLQRIEKMQQQSGGVSGR